MAWVPTGLSASPETVRVTLIPGVRISPELVVDTTGAGDALAGKCVENVELIICLIFLGECRIETWRMLGGRFLESRYHPSPLLYLSSAVRMLVLV